ncbi:3-methyl-2-oxobutanoate hydroxymethyltransferase [Campylobacter sp. FMV-PI01]|uniref:3-methyl-2-oxobutanoate hydroxymethyltransferase n=1 Tax=Campylobacter portucalensis TaxID=2608384 RepID=A0A6L5WLR0_9BACT|nr:3-methyl-2-oxobutanoate hydroxymethyltransferase [Campylobacter portucalensis]MSN96955.1 3-methyl-2-oxobutanoate hydroxymethyltransferase [Campylobacter portucalensis]
MHTKKVTINYLKNSKQKLTMITAYDALFASIFDGFVDMILVGDSLEMSFGGKNDTLEASMDSMIYHTKAVCNGAKLSYIIMDMPFGSVISKEIALKNSVRAYKETNADAIKIEATFNNLEIIKHIIDNGISVVAHIGLIPQNSRCESGYHIKGKSDNEADSLLNLALNLEQAGVTMIVVEGVVESVASKITNSLKIPVIGIGSGANTNGQVLVWSDMFGFFDKFKPKFVKRFLNGKELVQKALTNYIDEVKKGEFPSKEHYYKG